MRIEPLRELEPLNAAHRLERHIWQADAIPVSLLTVFAHHGGLVLGAYQDERLVGLAVAFCGRDPTGATYLHSHLTGVDPSYQGRGAGRQLKLAQREFARAQGYPYIGWTYDPLQAPNAWFNVEVLRARVVDIVENAYGLLNDGINRSAPSHRFWVRWDVEETNPGQAASPGPSWLVPIPRDITLLRKTDADGAARLADDYLQRFRRHFAQGRRITGVRRDGGELFYVLQEGRSAP
ncbi:MAG: GNAT family N-acetyltransferase [Thermaerobacter sp.]|nr:GNAT family N-acetyltransferase [Thermaerobacter sp.]